MAAFASRGIVRMIEPYVVVDVATVEGGYLVLFLVNVLSDDGCYSTEKSPRSG